MMQERHHYSKDVLGRAPNTFGEHRTCIECGKKLSRYNPRLECYEHWKKVTPRTRGRDLAHMHPRCIECDVGAPGRLEVQVGPVVHRQGKYGAATYCENGK